MAKTQHILDAARDFRTGSTILASQFGQTVFPLRTTIVAAVFSVELYIKFLLAASQIEPKRSHNLIELYGTLPPHIRNRVEAEYKGAGRVEDSLVVYKDVFMDWRYLYEKQHTSFSLDTRDLRFLVEAFEGAAGEIASSQ